MAVGWQIKSSAAGRLLFHNGTTGGSRAAIVLDPTHHRAVVVLTNSAALPDPTALALHLVAGSLPVDAPASNNRQNGAAAADLPS